MLNSDRGRLLEGDVVIVRQGTLGPYVHIGSGVIRNIEVTQKSRRMTKITA
jgi:hypothetical protein